MAAWGRFVRSQSLRNRSAFSVQPLEPRRLFAAADLITTLPAVNENINVQFDESAPLGAGPGLILAGHRGSDPESIYYTDAAGGNAVKLLTATTFSGTTNVGITALTAFHDKVYFFANTYVNSQLRDALYVTDGTPAGTQEVKLLRTGSANVLPGLTFVLNDRLHYFFQGTLWSTDGTTAGTTAVTNVGVDVQSISKVVNGQVFFGSPGKLWRTDGTAAGTMQVWTAPDANDLPRDFAFAGSKLFFINKGFSYNHLYVASADGTGASRIVVPVPNPQFTGFVNGGLTTVGDKVIFSSPEPQSHNPRIFASDGTQAGTVQLITSTVSSDGLSTPIQVAPDKVIFTKRFDGFWTTDGTAAGTVRYLPESTVDTEPAFVSVVQGRAFFNGKANGGGIRMIATDGTAAGTRTVHYLEPGNAFIGWIGRALPAPGSRIVMNGAIDGIPQLWSLDPDATTGSISGIAMFDQNRNGTREGFEPTLPGNTYIDSNENGTRDAGEVLLSTADGKTYDFTGLPAPHRYVVRFIPYGIYSNVPIDTPPGGAHVIDLQPGQALVNRDFGTSQAGTIIWGRAFNDIDADGARDAGENAPVAQQRMYLDLNGNGVFESGEPATMTSTVDGTYGFMAPAPGTYTVRRDDQAGVRQTTPASRGGSVVTVVADGSSEVPAQFGITPAAPVHIFGRVWQDTNADGIRDAAETAGAVNSSVTLYDDNGIQRGFTVTNSLGQYSFQNLPVDIPYRVGFALPSNRSFSPQDQGGDDARDSDPNKQTGRTAPILLAPGQTIDTVDAGLMTRTTVTGTVYRDVYADGKRDAAWDGGMNDWTVFIDADNDDVLDAGEVSTTTNASGAYTFHVQPGTYRIAAVAQPGYLGTTPAASRNGTVTLGAAVTVDVGFTTGGPSREATPIGPEFRVSESVESTQYRPRIGSDGAGNVVAVWWADGPARVMARRFDASGNPLGGEFQVSAGTFTNSNADPVVAVDSAGSFVVAWKTNTDIAARRFAADGTPLGAQFKVNQSGGTMNNPRIAADPTGGFAVAWSGQVGTGGDVDTTGVALRLYDSGGNPRGDEIRANDVATGSQSPSSLAFDPGGRLTVVYTSGGQDGNSDGVYMRRFSAGIADGPATLVNVTTTGSQHNGSVAINAAGVRLITWIQGSEIFGRLFSPNNTPIAGEFRINTNPGGAGSGPAVIALPEGNFVVAWAGGGRDGNGMGTAAQLVDSNGLLAGREFRLNTYATADQEYPTLAPGAGGNTFFAAWSSFGQDGFGAGVYAQRFETFLGRAAIGDLVFDDVDADGVQDAGEGGLSNITVELLNEHGSIADSTVTTAAGAYRFNALKPGNGYQVRFVTPTPRIISPQDVGGNDTTDSDADRTTGRTSVFAAGAPGSFNPSIDAGMMLAAQITGVIFHDLDGDGVQDSGENGIAGLTVFVDTDNDGQLDAGERSMETSAGLGGFNFTGLQPGTHTIAYVPLLRWSTTTPGANLTKTVPGGQSAVVQLGLRPTAPDGPRATPAGTESPVNTTTAGGQFGSDVASDAAGNYAVAWTSTGPSVVVQRFSANGTKVGGEIRPTLAAGASGPSIAMADDGRFVLVFAGTGGDVLAQRYAANGTTLGTPFVVNTTTADVQTAPDVAVEGDGDFVVVWQSKGQDGVGEGVYARRFAADGTPRGGEFRASGTAVGDQFAPSVGVSDAGGFAVSWVSTHVDAQQIFARRFDPSGAPLGNEFQVNTPPNGTHYNAPQVAMNAAGEFVIAYTGFDASGIGIEAHRYDALGRQQGISFIASGPRGGFQEWPGVAINEDGTFFIVWREGNNEVGGQLFNGSGQKLGDEVLINTTTQDAQYDPAVAMQPGGAVVTWTSAGQDGSDTGIYSQRFALTDAPAQVAGVFVNSASWTSTFRNFLQSSGQGDATLGFRIDAGGAQVDELPWTNINQISIRFSEHVNVNREDLVLRGINVPVYTLANGDVSPGFSYNPATFTATWTILTSGVGADKLLLDLDADAGTGVTDSSGQPLDGEWLNPTIASPTADTFPSGNGTPGGDFRFRLNVLPGDANRSGGSVIGSDVTLVRNAQNASPGAAGSLYTIFKDVNGSGSILGSDVTLVRNNQGKSLPAGEPVVPAMAVAVRRPTMPVLVAQPPTKSTSLEAVSRKRLTEELL